MIAEHVQRKRIEAALASAFRERGVILMKSTRGTYYSPDLGDLLLYFDEIGDTISIATIAKRLYEELY